MSENYNIELTADEALILFDFISRYSETDQLIIEDQAEQRALWNLECRLQKILAEPFDPSYQQLVQAARNRLRDEL